MPLFWIPLRRYDAMCGNWSRKESKQDATAIMSIEIYRNTKKTTLHYFRAFREFHKPEAVGIRV